MRMNASYRLRPPPSPAYTPKIKKTPREIITSFRVSISCRLTLCFVVLHLAEIIIDSNFSLLSQQFLVTFWTTTGDHVETKTAATARASKEQKETTNKQQQVDRQQQIQHGIKVWTHKKENSAIFKTKWLHYHTNLNSSNRRNTTPPCGK